MTKKDLAKELSKRLDITEKLAIRAIQETFYIIEEKMKDEKVRVTGFGTFSVIERAERTFTHPVTRVKTVLPADKAPIFRYSRKIRDRFKHS